MAIDNQPIMSKTQHYRKVTKPLLERKRRARMNHYLDELKELIIETMESNGEHVTKLEKADILELTVEYLKSKREQQQQQQKNQSESKLLGSSSDEQSLTKSSNRTTDAINVEKFRAGYTQAAYEVSKVFASVPGINVKFGSRLMKHLAYQLKDLYPVQSSILSSSSSPSVSDVDYDDDDDNKDRKIIDKKSSELIGLHQLDNNKISLNYHHYQHHNHHYNHQHQHQHHHHHHHLHQNQQNHNEHLQYNNHNDRHYHPYLLYDRNQQNQNHHQQLSAAAALAAEQHNHLNDDNDDINIHDDDEHKNLLPSANDVWRPW